MASDWSLKEDGRPGARLIREQPEKTARGDMHTWLVQVDWPSPMPCQVQVYILEHSGQYLIDHGRMVPLYSSDEDGA